MNLPLFLLLILAGINILAFGILADDKRKSIRGNASNRVPEGLLFFLATIFGGVGIYLGMLVFRHKTRRWYFQIGIPLIILQNLLIIYLIFEIVG
jgi:uncharacterized membrane protein YsdA (DUF1294 family)